MSTLKNGIILSCVGGRYTVLCEGRRFSCYAKGSLRHAGIKPVCGDRVTFVCGASFEDDGTPLPPSTENDGYLTEVLERKNVLRRPPIANLDNLLIFLAAANPKPDLVYVDRLIVCAEYNRIEPIIICNKEDLAPDVAKEITKLYQKSGFRAYSFSAENEELCLPQELINSLCDKTTAAAGFSGVGKTTFFNRLFPSEKGAVGELSAKLARGKNTTRTTELHSLKRSFLSIDGLFADTAGFSRLELDTIEDLSPENLAFYFREFAPLLGTCRYTKCTHTAEEDCAIRRAVENGEIPKERYESFLTLYNEIPNKKY